MHTRNSIVNAPLLIGIVLSIALHGAALYSKGIYTQPQPKLESGKTVVQLTLIPTIASRAASSETEKTAIEPEKVIAPTPEKLVPKPISVPEPIAEPPSEPVVENIPEPQPQETSDSIEQNASLIEDKGVSTEASSSSPISPKYPRRSQRKNEEGLVTLSVRVLASGKTGDIRIIQSSGHKRLDEAAVKAVERASFEPARKFGHAVESEKEFTFTFNLTDE